MVRDERLQRNDKSKINFRVIEDEVAQRIHQVIAEIIHDVNPKNSKLYCRPIEKVYLQIVTFLHSILNFDYTGSMEIYKCKW